MRTILAILAIATALTLTACQTAAPPPPAPDPTPTPTPATITSTGFTVYRPADYSHPSITLRNVTNTSGASITNRTLYADCIEEPYDLLETYFAATVTLEPYGYRSSITLYFDSGFPYFTDGTVYCSVVVLGAPPVEFDWVE